MKKAKLFLATVVILMLTSLVSCESTEMSTYRIDVSDMSTNCKSNLLLQIALNDYISTCNEEASTTLRTEKEAREWFHTTCDEVVTYINNNDIPMLDESWVQIDLSDFTTVVESRRVYFGTEK